MRCLLLVVLAACGGGDGEPPGKEEVTCGASWGTAVAGSCDSACVEMMTGTGPSCATTIQTGSGTIMCQTTFDFEGERGCCYDAGMPSAVRGAGEPARMRRVFFLSCD